MIMNVFQTCQSTYDAVPLYLPQQLYLKPIARLNISLQLPSRITGKNISNWEIMEQLRQLIKPEEFAMLKVIKNSVEVVRFVAELEEKSQLEKVIAKINKKMIKLKEFPEMLRLKAAEAKLDFPTRHSWDSFFREAKNMNEMKPGERPDTIHISNLPIKWFVSHHFVGDEDAKPSEKIFYRVFEKFGTIRHVDIPICDPYRRKMKIEVSGMQMLFAEDEHFFEGYVQFRDYVGFSKAMDALRGMKLLHKQSGINYTVNINVDFDKTKHLSSAAMRRREIVRDRLVKQEITKEEKEQQKKKEQQSQINSERQKAINLKNEKERRRREREEKRKAKLLAQLKMKGSDEINDKIAKEEKKLLKIQRKLEAIRLVEELFKRIKSKHEKSASLYRDERDEDELTRMKHTSEKEVLEQKQKLHRVIEGRTVLKSVLGSRSRRLTDSSNSDSSTSARPKNYDHANTPSTSKAFVPNIPQGFPGNEWYGFPVAGGMYPYIHPGPAYPPPSHPATFLYSRGRPNPRRGGRLNLRSRGGYRGPRNSYPPEMQEAYQRYFRKFLHEHEKRSGSFSPSRSRTKSRSRSRQRSRSRLRRRSYTRSYTRSRSRSRSEYRSRHRSRSRSRSRGTPVSKRRSRSRGTQQSKRCSRSRDTPHSRRRSRSRGTPASKRRSRSKGTPSASKRSTSKSVRRSRSVDSSKFISPKRFRDQRSKSWSMPKVGDKDKNRRTWSRSPPP